jgi:outer membrane protein TolC
MRAAGRRVLLALALLAAPVGCRSVADHPNPAAEAGPVLPAAFEQRRVAGPTPTPQPGNDFRTGGPVIPPPVSDLPIDLATALTLAGVDNPTIALAEEAVRAGEAEQLEARALLLPTLSAGASFDWHDGTLQSSQGIIRNVERQSVYFGAGASAVGAGTVTVPGVRLVSHLADALYAPRIARDRLTARQFDAVAVRNAILLDVATSYLALVGAEEQLRAVRESEREFNEVARLTADFAEQGVRRQGDADRAASEAHLFHAEEERAQEEVAVAAAELSRLLHLDPSARLHGDGAPVPLLQLVDPQASLEQLVATAAANRPEIGAREAELAARRAALRQEQVRPFLPLLFVGYSAGGFGGEGADTVSRLSHPSARADFDVFAVWSLQNFGLGNVATQRERRAVLDAGAAERDRVLDQVRREVAEAYAAAAAARRDLDVARRQLHTAKEGYGLDRDRVRTAPRLGRPIELLNSATLLAAGRQEYVRALIAFDQAQFRLFAALGQPPALPGEQK